MSSRWLRDQGRVAPLPLGLKQTSWRVCKHVMSVNIGAHRKQ